MDAERGELRFFVSVSIALHVAVLLLFQLTGIGRGGGNGGVGAQPTEVSFFAPPKSESASSDEGALPAGPRSRRRGVQVAMRGGGARLAMHGVRSTAPEGVPVPEGESRSPALCMRDC